MRVFDEAAQLVANLAVATGTEELALGQAGGRILACDVTARIDSPRSDVSAMDGYAVREADIRAGTSLPIAGRSYPGDPFVGALPLGSSVRIFTGGPVPSGADRVIIQEIVEETEGRASFRAGPEGPRFIRKQGSDFQSGDFLLRAGQVLTPGALMAAGGGDVGAVTVRYRPQVGLLVTGDELVAPGRAANQAAAVPDSISAALIALVSHWGGEVSQLARLGDEVTASIEVARSILDDSDVLLITGGASVGEKDMAKFIFAELGGELLFSKVAMKPGKPVWAGRTSGRPVLGLPGNPTSALVTARLFLAPLLAAMTGRRFEEGLAFRQLPLADDLADVGDRETFLRGYDLGTSVGIATHQDSNGQFTPGVANLLVRVAPARGRLPAGTLVPVLSL